MKEGSVDLLQVINQVMLTFPPLNKARLMRFPTNCTSYEQIFVTDSRISYLVMKIKAVRTPKVINSGGSNTFT